MQEAAELKRAVVALQQENAELRKEVQKGHDAQIQLIAELHAGEQLLKEVQGMRQELKVAKDSVDGVAGLYFAALTVSIKLGVSFAGLPITEDVTSLLQGIQKDGVKMEDWPMWLCAKLAHPIHAEH